MKPEGKHHKPELDRCHMVSRKKKEENFGENPKVGTYARVRRQSNTMWIGEITKDHKQLWKEGNRKSSGTLYTSKGQVYLVAIGN